MSYFALKNKYLILKISFETIKIETIGKCKSRFGKNIKNIENNYVLWFFEGVKSKAENKNVLNIKSKSDFRCKIISETYWQYLKKT